jgi:hypothetical protein
MYGIGIKFEFEVKCDYSEPNRYVHIYQGQIFGKDDSDTDHESNSESDVRLGEVEVYLVTYGRIINERSSLFEAMDAASSETMECYEAIIDQETNNWKEEVQSLIGEDGLVMYDILLINRLELNERYRGKGIGAQVALEVIKALGSNCAVIACKPFPLQYRGSGEPEHAKDRAVPGYEQKRRVAFRKVSAFWKKVGFKKLPSSDHCIWVQ